MNGKEATHRAEFPMDNLGRDRVDSRDSVLSKVEGISLGTIRFKRGDGARPTSKARYAHFRSDVTDEHTLKLFANKWLLRMPKLLINICGTGGYVKNDKNLQELLSQSLLHAAQNIDAWLLTSGVHKGIVTFLGKAMRDYSVGRPYIRKSKVVCIGIVDLKTIENSHLFEEQRPDTSGYNKTAVTYSVPESDSEDKTYLDPNHGFFLLVDGPEVEAHENALRTNSIRCTLMKLVSRLKIYGCSTTTPVVSLIIGGNAHDIRAVSHMVNNALPFVIIKGTGGAADILAYACTKPWLLGNDPNAEEATIKVMSYVNVQLQQLCGSEDRVELLGHIKNVMKKKRNFSIYDLEGGKMLCASGIDSQRTDLMEAIIHSLPKDEKGSRLQLAVVWNFYDMARLALNNKKTWKPSELQQAMSYALCNDQTDIIRLFLEHGISLRSFITPGQLTYLYNQVEFDCLLHELLLQQKDGVHRAINLNDIGNLLKTHTFNDYQPLYLEAKDSLAYEDPVRELFIWAVLQARIKTARLLWLENKSPIAGALLACKLMNTFSDIEEEPQQREEMKEQSGEYERWAINVMDEYYREDRKNTSLVLIRELQNWGSVSCLCLASAARAKQFIAHPAVQIVLREIWSGKVGHNSELKKCVCMIFPPLSALLLKFRHHLVHGVADQHIHTVTHDAATNFCQWEHRTSRRNFSVSSFEYGHYRQCSSMKRPRNPPNRNCSVDLDAPERLETYDYDHESISTLRKLRYFLSSPFIIFRYNVISYLTFCILFSYILIFKFQKDPTCLEYLLMFWVFTIFTEEVREILEEEHGSLWMRFRGWLTGYWNIIDCASIMFFALGIALRFLPGYMEKARIMLTLDMVVFYLRLLHIFSTNRHLGPKLIMIMRMFTDVVVFICVIFVFLVSYCVTCLSLLYPNSSEDPRAFRGILRDVMYTAYFQMFGELFLNDFDSSSCPTNLDEPGASTCEDNSWFRLLALAVYLFIVNLLLLNLLIAMLNYTFSSIQENCDVLWKYQRLSLLKEYLNRPPLPPPFIIICHVNAIIGFLWGVCFGACLGTCILCRKRRKLLRVLDDDQNEEIATWEIVKGEEIVRRERTNVHQAGVNDILRLVEERRDCKTDKLMHQLKKQESTLGKLDRRLNKIEEQLAALVTL